MFFNCVSLISENQHQWNKCNQYLANGKFCRLLQSRFGDMVLDSQLHFPRTFLCYEKRVGALSYSWNTLWILDYSKQMNLFTWKPTSGGPKWFSFAKSARATKNVFRMFSHSLHRWSIPQEVKCIKEGFAGACCDDPSAECTKEFASPKKYIQPHKHTNIQTYKLKNTIDQNPLLSDDPSLVYMNQFTSQRNTQKHTNIHNKKHHS